MADRRGQHPHGDRSRLAEENPQLRDKLFLPNGGPRAHFLVYLNGRVVHREDLEKIPVHPDAEVKIFTVLAGG